MVRTAGHEFKLSRRDEKTAGRTGTCTGSSTLHLLRFLMCNVVLIYSCMTGTLKPI